MKRCFRKLTTIISVLILLFVSVSITACGDETPDTQSEQTAEGESKEEAKEESTREHEKAVKVEDGTMSENSTVIAVGQTSVSYREYKMYYYFMQNQYDELLGDQVWKQSAGSDKTIGQEAIEDVLRMIIQVKVICKVADSLGVSLEADEKEDADYNAKKLCESLDEKTKTDNMIDVQQMMTIFEENRLAEKVYSVTTGTSDVSGNVGESSAYRVLLLFKKAGSDKEKTRQEVEKLQQKISTSNKSFYAYARQESDLDEVEAIVGSMDERKNLWMQVMSMKNYVVSPVIEEQDGFYIAMVVEKPNEEINTEYRNQVVTEKQIAAFQKSYEEWSKNFDVDVSESLLSDK